MPEDKEKKKSINQYKVSKNCIAIPYNNEVILFNTIANNIVKINKHSYEDIVNNLNNIGSDRITRELINRKIFIPDNMNEDSIKNQDKFLSLTLLPTMDCNFRCPYCYEEHIDDVMNESTIERLITFAKEQLESRKGIFVSWFGGEPLLKKELIYDISERLIDLCKKVKKPYYAIMTTNGYLLDFETYTKLRKYKVMNYQITLDGVKDTHNTTRILDNGEGTFDTIVHNLKEIGERDKSLLGEIIIRTNVTEEIYKRIDEYVEFYDREFGKYSKLKHRFRFVFDNGEHNSFSTGVLKVLNDESNTEKFNFFGYKKDCRSLSYSDLADLLIDEKNKLSLCYAASPDQFLIMPDGQIGKCTVNLYSKCNNIGSLYEEGYFNNNKDLWQLTRNDIDGTDCQRCFLHSICNGMGCQYPRANKDINQIKEACKTAKSEFINKLLFLSKFDFFCQEIKE